MKQITTSVQTTLQQQILIDYINNFFNINNKIKSIRVKYYQGSSIFFNTYNAKKIYLCVDGEMSSDGGVETSIKPVFVYNENNSLSFTYHNVSSYHDGSFNRHSHNNFKMNNIYFSRLDNLTAYKYISIKYYEIELE